MKIIVLGTGVAGYGAYLACRDEGKLDDVTFYNYGKYIYNQKIPSSNFPGLRFPVKKEFNEDYQAANIEKSNFKIRYSDSQGGLSDFWSGSVSSFSDKDLELRNLNFLKDFYKLVSNKMDIMGPKDGLSEFCKNYVIKKNFESIPPLNCFDDINYNSEEISIHSENNKVLTSADCVMCGECFKGCERNVVFRPIKHFYDASIKNIKINHISMRNHKWHIYDHGGNEVDSCDAIFLACGTFQTIKLLNNSKLLDTAHVELYDSNAIIFPVKIKSFAMSYLKNYGYANKIISIKGKKEKKFDSQISIIPFNHFFTESIFGAFFAKFFNGLFLNHFCLGMFFSSADESNAYKIDKNNNLKLLDDRSKLARSTLINIANNINSSKNDFKIIKLLKSADSSIHYSSNLLNANLDFYSMSEYRKNLFIVDGNLFPGRPASNGNSFSILAGSYAVVKNFFTKKL